MYRKVPFIEQMEDSECGIACIAMVLGYYGTFVSLHEIRERYGISRGGSSLLQLINISSGYNFRITSYNVCYTKLLRLLVHCDGLVPSLCSPEQKGTKGREELQVGRFLQGNRASYNFV